MEFRSAVLDNGLEIVAELNPEAHTEALGFFVRTGARDETAAEAGVSHFLEHMMFKGTASRSADDVNREFDELGAQYNAFTSEELTVYYAAFLPEYQGRILALWGDMLRPALREGDFETEKQVILEEIRMYEDQPPFGADEKCRAAFFNGHPLGQSVLGTSASVGALTAAAMQDYFARRYSPQNIVLAAAGKVDFAALVDDARRHCSHWQRLDARRRVEPPRPKQGFVHLHKPQATQQYAIALAAGPSATDPDRYAAKVLAAIVGDDTGSRLFWELIDPGLADQASLGHYDYQGAGLMITYLASAPGRAAENLRRIRDVYRRVERDGVSDEELAQAKSKINSRVVLSGERSRGRLFSVGANWVARHEYRDVKDDLAAVNVLTTADLAAVLEKYPLSATMTVTIGPLEDLPAPG